MSRRASVAILLSILLFGITACGQGNKNDQPDLTNPKFLSLTDVRLAPEPIRQAAKAVVKLGTHPDGGGGTGAFISLDGLLLTNNHLLGVDVCPKSGCFISVSWGFEAGEKYDRKTVFFVPKVVVPELDFAILQAFEVSNGVQGAKLNVSTALDFAPVVAGGLVGTDTYLVGHPDLGLKKWSVGEIFSVQGHTLRADGFSLPGSSGSPMLDASGKVVGLLYAATARHDAITRSGIRHDSVGTISSAIVDALRKINNPEPPGMSLLLDTGAPLEKNDFLANTSIFLRAHVRDISLRVPANMQVGPTVISRSPVDIIGEALDTKLSDPLAVDDSYRVALLEGLLFDALYWLNCDPTTSDAYTRCPSEEQASRWRDRSEMIFAKAKLVYGSADYYLLSRVYFRTESTQTRAAAVALAKVLADADPEYLDASIADWVLYLTRRGESPIFAGKNLRDYILGYRQIPYYWNQFRSIISAFSTLFYLDLITADELSANLTAISNDPAVTLGERISAERTAYYAGVLE